MLPSIIDLGTRLFSWAQLQSELRFPLLHPKWLFLPACIIMLAACASSGKVTVKPYAPPRQGVLITDFHSNRDGVKLSLIRKNGEEIPDAIFEITPLDNFRVVHLPPGKYTWREIELGGRKRNIRDEFTFTIEADKLNYIGDVLVKVKPSTLSVNFINKSTQVQQRLQQDYQALYQRYPYVENLTEKAEE